MAIDNSKLMVGPRLRRFRQTLGLTQARMAEDLGISTSYLNLMERNQRALSAKVLLRMAEIYDFDMASFTGAGDAHLIAEVYEAFRDPLFKDESISKNEAEDIVNTSPAAARSFLKLYSKHREASRRSDEPSKNSNMIESGAMEAVELVRRFIHKQRNYFARLDSAAEALSDQLGLAKSEPNSALTERLKSKHDLTVKIMPVDVMPQMLRYFDRHQKRINLSELMRQSGRRFQLAFQIGMLEQRPLIDDIVKSAGFSGPEAERLLRTSLANYFAAATLMPYRRFLKQAENTKYDVDLLSHRFGTSFEQTAHRLTTLHNPDARGIPFFFVRIDVAGNISKRFSSGRFHISQFGGACPLWNVHECFQTPGKTITQMVQMPDESTYFSIARMVSRSDGTFNAPEHRLAIGLGCDVAYAPRLVYAQRYNLTNAQPTPIGVNCYLCERQHCRQRAHAPMNKTLSFDERARGMSLYSFIDE
ncbi:Xre family transcriptional regulator [Litorimonas taeanensis]|uniref:Xre family transcriptional regulator n=1 Tax=Litorimonas taeanensis TaxID=568099 RepID=A0A420WLU7_9PROT|nr:helix-turn-helix transcriptional regulator [Litorimonas taeanensis]RKQ71993.1 Xre family transcriptional regulator [Litorimonas taeanensis]